MLRAKTGHCHLPLIGARSFLALHQPNANYNILKRNLPIPLNTFT
jgi:hypothetical protein